MKTLLFTLEYPPFNGGVANYYYHLVKNYPQTDDIFVLHNNDGHLLTKWFWPHWLPACRALKREIKAKKIEHILVGQILPLGTIAYCRRIDYSVFLHGMDLAYSQKSWRKRILAKKILNKAKNIICNSHHTAYLAEQIVKDKSKIKVINPGVEMATTDENLVRNIKNKYKLDDKIVMLIIARLVKRKGQDKVLAALKDVEQSNLYYFIVGDGPDKHYLHDQAKGVKNVVFLGNISEEEKKAWLSICDFFAMPARSQDGDIEGFGMVYLEAAAYGKAVIAGVGGGVRDAVQGGLTGILVDPLNIPQISNAITKLATEEETRRFLGKNAQARAEKDFRWEDKAQKLFEIINKN